MKNTSSVRISREKNVLKDKDFFNNSSWTSTMTDTFSGMCHTFVNDTLCFRKGTNLHFILNYIIAVFVHDPEFFIFKNSNIFVPLLIQGDPKRL